MDLLRSLPLGLYLERPITWLHRLDPRIKLVWLMSFLLAPILASSLARLVLVLLLVALTLTARIPLRVWRQQMGWLLFFCSAIIVIGALAPDGLAADTEPRLPAADLTFFLEESANTPDLPQPTEYRYVLLDRGPVTITRRSLDLGLRLGTLIFTLVYSTNLYLLTTPPEAITEGLESLMQPLRRTRLPVTEIALTLTLSLRFIPLVLEEVQNLARSIYTRAINWKKIGFRGAIKIWLTVAERLLENLLMRAEQIASAMQVRGFTSPDRHRVRWHEFRLSWKDGVAIVVLVLFWVARSLWGGFNQ